MGLGGILRGLAGIGSVIPGPWQAPSLIASLGLGAYDAAKPHNQMPTGAQGAGAYGYANVPSLAQLNSEWEAYRGGKPLPGTLTPPPTQQQSPGFFGTLASLLGPVGLAMYLKKKGAKVPSSIPTTPGHGFYDPYMDDNPSVTPKPKISAAMGMGPTYLPQGATIEAHPGEVASVTPAGEVDPLAIPPGAVPGPPSPTQDQVRPEDLYFEQRSQEPLTIPPGAPAGPSTTQDQVRPADLEFERRMQGATQSGASKNLSQYLPLLLGGGALALASRQKSPSPPGIPSHLSSAFQGLVEGYAKGKLSTALENKRRQNEQQEFYVKQAHDAVMDASKINWDNAAMPPSLKQRFQELSQKYSQALSKDSPGGTLLTTAEAAEILAIKSSLDKGLAESGQARKGAEAAAGAGFPDTESYQAHQRAVAAGQEKQSISKELATRLGMPELEGTLMDARSLGMLLRKPAGSYRSGLVMRDGLPHRVIRDMTTGEETDLGVSPVKNEHYIYEDTGTGEKTRITAPPTFLGSGGGGARPSSPGISGPPVSGAPQGAPMGGKPRKLSAQGESAVLAVDQSLPLMKELKGAIEKAGLQNDNSLGSMAESRANNFLYRQGTYPGEYAELMNQLGGFVRANMLSNFPTRFRNQTMQTEITRHLIDPTRDSPKLMYSKLTRLIALADSMKKNVYAVEKVSPGGGSAPASGNSPAKVYNPSTDSFN